MLVAIVAGAVLVMAAGLDVVDRILSDTPEARAQARAEELRDEVRELRPRLERCLDELDRAEGAFRAQEAATEGLRARVEAFEEVDAEGVRGVPSDDYEDYIEVFERYNASLPEWERRAAEVEEFAAACRALAEAHNVRADSLRTLLVEAGIWEEEWLPPRPVVPDAETLPDRDPPGSDDDGGPGSSA